MTTNATDLVFVAAASAGIYLFLIVLLRVFGRRTLAELSAVDLVVMLCLGSAVETAMIRADTSLAAGVVSATVLLSLNWLLTRAVFTSRLARRLVLGGPVLVVHNGRVLATNAARCGLSDDDLRQAIRQRELESFEQVRFAVVEADGTVTVVAAR